MSETIVSAHQPNFMPYLGFFDKMRNSDIFVIRDEVLYMKKEFHNRNRIRINTHDNINTPGSKWISVPVEDPGDYIKHAKIKLECIRKEMSWHKQICHDINVNYKTAPFFKRYSEDILAVFDNSDKDLITLNMKLINLLRKAFNIKAEIIFASELGLKPSHYQESDGSEDLAKICEALGAGVYLSGQGGKNYLCNKHFERIGVKIKFQEYTHPVYPQVYPGFLPKMSAIDALFCIGQMPENKNPINE